MLCKSKLDDSWMREADRLDLKFALTSLTSSLAYRRENLTKNVKIGGGGEREWIAYEGCLMPPLVIWPVSISCIMYLLSNCLFDLRPTGECLSKFLIV